MKADSPAGPGLPAVPVMPLVPLMPSTPAKPVHRSLCSLPGRPFTLPEMPDEQAGETIAEDILLNRDSASSICSQERPHILCTRLGVAGQQGLSPMPAKEFTDTCI